MANTEILTSAKSLAGFIKIWRTNKQTGLEELVVDKPNMILKGGAQIIAHALGGKPAAKIWGMYIGYYNGNDDAPEPIIDVDYSYPFLNYVDPLGYLREPLTFTPNYLSSPGYEAYENTVLFSTMITTASKAGGSTSADFNADSQLYEVALISVPDVASPAKDKVFSRTSFNPIQYNSNYNFTITWGVRIIVPV
jgi:hypothetical protein